MMKPRTTGLCLLSYAIMAAVLRGFQLSVPVFKVPFVFFRALWVISIEISRVLF